MEGNLKVAWVPAFVDPAAPTVAEATAITGVDLSSFIKEGTFNLSGEQSTFEDRRLSSTISYETPGRSTRSIDDITYVYDPQAAPAAADNAAYQKLPVGTEGYFIVRAGLPFGDAFAATNIVDVWPVVMGIQRKQTPAGNAEGEKFTVIQRAFVTGPVQVDVAIAAI